MDKDEKIIPGTIIHSRYEVVAFLEQFRMERCYRVRDLNSGNPFRLQHLDFVYRFTDRETAAERYLSIAHRWQKAARDAGAALEPIVDIFMENGIPYVVLPERGTFFSLKVQDDPLKKRTVAENLLLPLCYGLESLHKADLWKLTLDKEDIIRLSGGQIQLIFRIDPVHLLPANVEHPEVWITGASVAPEVYRQRERLAPSADVYALSALLYQITSGEQLDKAIHRLIMPSRIRCPMCLSKYQQQALLQGLELRPQNRIQTLSEFREKFLHQEKNNCPT